MVVAEQMQHGVHREILRLVLKSAAVLLALRFGTLEREDHVAEIAAVRVIVHFVDREREHVRHTVFFPVNSVQIPNFGIADKRNAYFRIMWKLFHHQNCLTAAANQHPNPHWHFDCLLIVFHHNLYTHHFSTFLSR